MPDQKPPANNPSVTGWISNQPHLLLTLTALFWGGNAVAGKFAIGHVSPMVLTFSRWAIALTVVTIIARKYVKQDWPTIRQRIPYLLIMGATGYTLFNVLLYSALQYTSAINATIVQSAMPLVIFLANLVMFGLAIRANQIIGYLLTLVGVMLVVANGTLENLLGLNVNFGDLLMLVAVAGYAGYSVALRSKPAMHWLSFLWCLMVGAVIASIPAVGFEWQNGAAQFPVTLQGMLVVAYAGLFPSILSQAFFIRGVEMLGANSAGLFVNLVPIFGTFLAVTLIGESFSLSHGIALVLVVGGILIAQRS